LPEERKEAHLGGGRAKLHKKNCSGFTAGGVGREGALMKEDNKKESTSKE
jgi:hypothetical protein